ncbi:hypothetical protein HW130_04605 [Streptomyces sp. PKU-EA00015]|uniref:hypothetical protein n=1 Tax=Streptomyces sp. PKU-EA00015 TaxID=2748326 RepID=UPI0015A495A6|nr:hypothetical protein [Streptomyces sp. PKU-EA00015]
MSAISVWANPNASWRTNTARSRGLRISITTSSAIDTASVRSARSAVSVVSSRGPAASGVISGSGSHGPMQVSRRRLILARQASAWFTAMRTR